MAWQNLPGIIPTPYYTLGMNKAAGSFRFAQTTSSNSGNFFSVAIYFLNTTTFDAQVIYLDFAGMGNLESKATTALASNRPNGPWVMRLQNSYRGVPLVSDLLLYVEPSTAYTDFFFTLSPPGGNVVHCYAEFSSVGANVTTSNFDTPSTASWALLKDIANLNTPGMIGFNTYVNA